MRRSPPQTDLLRAGGLQEAYRRATGSGRALSPLGRHRKAAPQVVAREEIFGPVLAMIGYQDLDDAVAIANDSDFGLGGDGFWDEAFAAL